MDAGSFVYYGYSPETFKECRSFIQATNRKHVEIVNLWFTLVNVFFLVFSWFNMFGVNRSRIMFYAVFVGVSVVFEILLFAFRAFIDKHFTLAVYFCISMLLVYSILASNAQPYMVASMYLVLLVIAALSFIDNMLRMSLVLTAFTVVFLFESFQVKPESIAIQDTYNVIVFFTLSLVFHYSFQHARIRQFETYQKNIRIQRELEVQSSFDSLTSLLNRARFFSMASQVLRADNGDEYIAIALLDLDGFKQINDTMGHQMGDKVIQVAASKIMESIGIDLSEKWSFPERALQNDLSFAGRLGGDEFIVFIRGMKDTEEIHEVMKKLLSDLNDVRFEQLEGIRASIGVSEVGSDDRDIDKIYSRIDSGLYESKKQGKNRVTFC